MVKCDVSLLKHHKPFIDFKEKQRKKKQHVPIEQKVGQSNYSYETGALSLTDPLITNNFQKIQEKSNPFWDIHTQKYDLQLK